MATTRILLDFNQQRHVSAHLNLLAIYLAIRHFRHSLEGCHFHVPTPDHKPLTYALGTTTDRHSSRQIRHLDFVSPFTCDIRHVKGGDNPAADALSRVDLNTLRTDHSSLIDFRKMAELQKASEEVTQLCTSPSSINFKEVPLPSCDTTLICDVSTGNPCSIWQAAFPDHYVWPGINREVRQWAKSCVRCQRSKVHRHTFADLHRSFHTLARSHSPCLTSQLKR